MSLYNLSFTKKLLCSADQKDDNSLIQEIHKKFPDKYPLIITKSSKSTLAELNCSRYLIPRWFTIIQVQSIIKNKLNKPKQQLILLVDNKTIIKPFYQLDQIFNKYKSQDGFLYLNYLEENILG